MQTGVIIALLAVGALGLPALLFEISWRRAPRREPPVLSARAEFVGRYVRLTWEPVPVPSRYFFRYTVLRESIGRPERETWTIPDAEQTVLDDWGIRPGQAYRYIVFQVVPSRARRERAIHTEVLITVPALPEGDGPAPGRTAFR